MKVREIVLNDIVSMEFFHTYTINSSGKKVYTYEAEYPADKEKFETEDSTWIVFIYDCLNEYYLKNKEYFDNVVNETLKLAIT